MSDGIEMKIRCYYNEIRPVAYARFVGESTFDEVDVYECTDDCTCSRCACSMCGSNAAACDGQCTNFIVETDDLTAPQVRASSEAGDP